MRWIALEVICSTLFTASMFFQIELRGGGNTPYWGMGNFAGKDFFIRWLEPEEERFSPRRPFPKLKKHFLIIEHRLKSKLAWPVYIRSMKLK